MNAYDPSRPLLRSVFAIAAVAATVAVSLFIDGLAQSYSAAGQQVVKSQAVVVAAAKR